MTSVIKYNKDQINSFRELALIAARSGNYAGMSEATLLNLMLSAADLGVSPMKAINGGFHVIKGKISMASHLMSDRIRAAGHSIRVIEHTRDKCVIIGIRSDNKDSYKSEFDMEDAKLGGLLNSPTWRAYPKDMLYNRALARLARILFSDVVGSCYSEDEGFDIQGTPPEKRIAKDPDQDNSTPISENMAVAIESKAEFVPAGSMERLKESFELDGIPSSYLEEYVQFLAHKKSKPIEEIIESAMQPEIAQLFKAAYVKKFMKKQEVVSELVDQPA